MKLLLYRGFFSVTFLAVYVLGDGQPDPACSGFMYQGQGRKITIKWFYLNETRLCYPFRFGGRDAKANNHNSCEDCLKKCTKKSEKRITNICSKQQQ
uniref:Pancreatic trypsin inhibitor n=1 Tax=Rhipicephalus zambeziensis TaxID=60191 RepID=A0A224Y2F1_9ACAR